MSHHFDTPTAREDPRINVCDFYLFRGGSESTVMAMTVNANAGVGAPDSFRDEAIYAFRFDLDSDRREDVTFKVRFGAVAHADGGEHHHVQQYEVRRATGADALRGANGELIVAGSTGSVATTTPAGAMAFAGLAPDLFAGDSAALGTFRSALFDRNEFHPEAFQNRQNFFDRRNVCAIVIEVPTRSIGDGLVHAWATASLYGHAPEVQVSRWGLPLLTNVFMPDMDMREGFNRASPEDDLARFGGQIGSVAERLTMLAGSAGDPRAYGSKLAERLLPAVLPYRLGTPASFDFAGFNGRGLTDDVMDVLLTLAANTALSDGVAPNKARTRDEFPYFGEAFTPQERAGAAPNPAPAKK
jgi:Domain of unknown function (DUF4331)